MNRLMWLSSVAAVTLLGGIAAGNAQQSGMGTSGSQNKPAASSGMQGGGEMHGRTNGTSGAADRGSGMHTGRSAADTENKGGKATGSSASEGRSESTQSNSNMRSSPNTRQNNQHTSGAQEHRNGANAQNGMNSGRSVSSGEERRNGRNNTGAMSPNNAGGQHNRQGANNQKEMNSGRSVSSGQNRRNENNENATNRNNATPGAQQGGNMRNGQQTEGRSSTGSTHVTAEEQTRLRSVDRNNVHVREAANVNIDVAVGRSVPRTITEYWAPVPQEFVRIVPAWRAYRIVKVRNELLIIDPRTFEIVYVIAG